LDVPVSEWRRKKVLKGVLALLLAAFGVVPALAGALADDALKAAGTPVSCPVTVPNGKQPPSGENVFGRGPGGHGNAGLWTNVWTWGEGIVEVPPTHVNPDGSLGGMKWPWWRGVPGRLTIEGRRLDADAPPLRAEVPDGYGERGFQPSGLIFPTTGCWEVTGRVGDASLTFVLLVDRVDASGTPIPEKPTPVGQTGTPNAA
jgi:hypothetical protein